MPIVDVELVAGPNGVVAAGLAQSLADAVGRALKSPAGQTWVRLHLLAREQYAENESSVDSSELPVFVFVLKRELPVQAELAAEVSALTSAIALALVRPASCVHIEYAPAANGRLSFGGKLIQ
jgi:phenylpyruvate tautomerase PptA (4-oxalocrotonate tautomerase family)